MLLSGLFPLTPYYITIFILKQEAGSNLNLAESDIWAVFEGISLIHKALICNFSLI